MENKYVSLMKYYEDSKEKVKRSAMEGGHEIIEETKDSVNLKVNDELILIKKEVNQIDSKFSEENKNYSKIKDMISKVMVEYETSLKKLTDYYDRKIEDLILKKVEIEAALIMANISVEYFNDKEIIRNYQKENDRAKKSITETIGNFAGKILKNKNENKSMDPYEMRMFMDSQDVVNEIDATNNENYDEIIRLENINKTNIENYKKEIAKISEEIVKLKQEKIEKLTSAFEKTDSLDEVRHQNFFQRIIKFFEIRLNRISSVEKYVILPLKHRIEEYNKNELSAILK